MKSMTLMFVAAIVVLLAGPVFAAATLDPASVQTAITDQLTAMVAPVLAILAVGLAIAAGRAAFKRFLKV